MLENCSIKLAISQGVLNEKNGAFKIFLDKKC